MSLLLTIASPLVLGVSAASEYLVWRWKLRPARLYQGESGIRPARDHAYLSAEWYVPEVRPWLWLARILSVVCGLSFVTTFLSLVSR